MKTRELTINVSESASIRYSVWIGANILGDISRLCNLSQYTKAAVVTDSTVAKHWLKALLASLPIEVRPVMVSCGESAKSIETLKELWLQFAAMNLDRSSVVLNLGGGSLCDVGGFAACTYMRGISHINIPTTLLAQVDAGIGGKVGIDLAETKNLVGSFSHPRAVLVDVQTLSTLPKRDLSCGFAEIIKHGLIADREFAAELANFPWAEPGNSLVPLLAKGISIKQRIVERDPYEKGERALLNFGHTLGHAFEALALDSPGALLHGEAVALGIIGEAKISEMQGKIGTGDVEFIEKLLTHYNLPVRLKFDWGDEQIFAKLRLDKKSYGGETRWTLLNKIGEGVAGCKVEAAHVAEAVKSLQRG